MAPGRRKGRATAAAAGASQLHWKIGDLVLAKVKGFPPWPAMISDPQKWGYSLDRRKLFVYFFGTKQIAFCNHADVEAFTEEKRKYLLGKRQGKGADFTRAVNEIIQKFERLTEYEINNEMCSTDNVESHFEHAEDFGINHSKKNFRIESFSSSNGQLETLCSQPSDDSESSEVNPTTHMEDDTADNKLMTRGSHNFPVSVVECLGNVPIASHAKQTQRRALSSHRASSKIRNNSFKLQENDMQVEDENDDSYFLAAETTDNCMQSDYIPKRKYLDVHDTFSDVSTLVEKNEIEDTEFGAANVERETYPSNEHRVTELICNGESILKNSGEGLAVDRGFETQRKYTVLKKRRKPSKKWSDQEGVKARCEQSEQSISVPFLSDSWRNPNDKLIQTEGDEHLPLVKRARVRMGNILDENRINDFAGTMGKYENDVLPHDCNLSSSSDGGSGYHEISRNGFDAPMTTDDQTLEVGEVPSLPLKERSCQSRGDAIAVEAALPPSKRLSRALEAMSANATEVNNGRLEAFTSIPSFGGAQVSEAEASHDLLDGKCNSLIKSDGTFSPNLNLNSSIRNQYIVNKRMESLEEVKWKDISHENCLSFQNMNCGAKEKDTEDSEEFPCLTVTTRHGDRSPHDSFSLVIDERNKQATQSPENKMLTAVSDYMDDDSKDDNVAESLSDDKHGVDQQKLVAANSLNTSDNGSDFSSDSNSKKNLILASQAGLLSPCGHSSNSNDAKLIVDEKSSHKLSPKGSTVSHTDHFLEVTSGSSQSVDKSCDPVCQDNELAQSRGFARKQSDNSSDQNKESLPKSPALAEASAATKSFKTLLCSLSRTKESIDHATCVAIDCAKCGIAAEVVQILVHSLESTVNPSRKLDLFFLVDSIAQRSRVQKGVSEVSYHSLFQPVLSRLLFAAAPPGDNACENRRQCIKVLKLWGHRGILLESVVQHHIRELESTGEASSPPKAETTVSYTIREMEGMFVDKCGCDRIQIPCASDAHPMEEGKKENECAGSERDFETVTSESDCKVSREAEKGSDSFFEKNTCILEDVDGELEMEDVAPQCPNREVSASEPGKQPSSPVALAPPLPADKPPSPPPLPSSPPPAIPLFHPVLSVASRPVPLKHGDDQTSHSFPSGKPVQYSLSSHGPCDSSMNLRPGDGSPRMLLTSSPCHYQHSYANPLGSPHSAVYSASDSPSARNNKGYHIQSPPPRISKFSHDYAEKHHHRFWSERNHSSPFHRRLQIPNEALGGSHPYSNVCSRRPVHNEFSDRCSRFSPTARSVPKFLDKAEGSPNVLPHCGPGAQVPNGWSTAPRASSYHFPVSVSRPPLENKFSRLAGAPGYWRPR